jgi:hypothetical protein
MRDTTQRPPATNVLVATVLVRSVNNVPYPLVSLSLAKMHDVVNTKMIGLGAKDNTIVLEVSAGEYSWTDVTLTNLVWLNVIAPTY